MEIRFSSFLKVEMKKRKSEGNTGRRQTRLYLEREMENSSNYFRGQYHQLAQQSNCCLFEDDGRMDIANVQDEREATPLMRQPRAPALSKLEYPCV